MTTQINTAETLKHARAAAVQLRAQRKTLNEKLAFTRAQIVTLKSELVNERAAGKAAREAAKVARKAKTATRNAERIAKLEAKLAALRTPKALKRANRKASPVKFISQAA